MRVPRRASLLVPLVLAALIPATAAAAPVSTGHAGWIWGSPQPQGATLNDLSAVGLRAYAVGAFGTILRTDDAGATWLGLPSPTTQELTRVDAVDADTAVLAGACLLLRTDDAGKTFETLPIAAGEGATCPTPIAAFDFPAERVGYVVLRDGTVLRTDDGGQTFAQRTSIPLAAPGATVTDLAFLDGQTAVAVTSDRRILRTADAGGSWTLAGSDADPLRAVRWTSPTTLLAVGANGSIERSDDAGLTWTASRVTIAGGAPDLVSLSCATPTTCVAGTADGRAIVRTADRFATATAVAPSTSAIRAAELVSATRVLGVGDAGATVISEDTGATYGPVGARLLGSYSDVVRGPSAGTAYALGLRGALARTTDGGRTWTAGAVPTSSQVRAASFVSSQVGFAVDSTGTVRRTDNGGASWKVLSTGTQGVLYEVLALSEQTLFVGGPRGARRSTDGGRTFQAISGIRPASGRDTSVYRIVRAGSSRVVFGGPSVLFASDDRGRTVKRLGRPSKAALLTGDWASAKVGMVVDSAGQVWRTTDGARTWKGVSGIGAARPATLVMSSASEAWATSSAFGGLNAGWVLRTTDGGASWTPQLVGAGQLASVGPFGARALAQVGSPGAAIALSSTGDLFATTGGGRLGESSTLTLRASRTRLSKAGNVTLRGRISPVVGGEQVVLSLRQHGSRVWRTVTTQTGTDGSFSVTRRYSARKTDVVAQWAGDGARDGDGSTVVTIAVGR